MRRRRRITPNPKSAVPSRARLAGSGTAAAELATSNVRVSLIEPPGKGGLSLNVFDSEVNVKPPIVTGDPARRSTVSGSVVGDTSNTPSMVTGVAFRLSVTLNEIGPPTPSYPDRNVMPWVNCPGALIVSDDASRVMLLGGVPLAVSMDTGADPVATISPAFAGPARTTPAARAATLSAIRLFILSTPQYEDCSLNSIFVPRRQMSRKLAFLKLAAGTVVKSSDARLSARRTCARKAPDLTGPGLVRLAAPAVSRGGGGEPVRLGRAGLRRAAPATPAPAPRSW